MEQTIPQPGGTYQPVGVPVPVPKHPGMTQGISGLICAIVALLFFPPLFGIAGIILGVLAIRKGERAIGIVAIVLSAVFMILGLMFNYYIETHPNLLKPSSMSGAVIQSLMQQ